MKRRLYSILWYGCWGLAAELVAGAICFLPLREHSILFLIMLLISVTWWIQLYVAYRTRVVNDSWRDWGERQYRTQSVKCPCAMVYIKEADGSIEKVFTGLPEGVSFHKNYEVVTNSDEELLIRGRGTNVCNRLVGKQKGRWRAYQHEGNEIRYFDELWF